MHKRKIVHIFRTIGIYHRVPVLRLDILVFSGRFELFESHLYSAVAAAVTARAAHGNVNFLSTCKGHPPLPLRRPTRRRQHGGWPRNVISVGLVTSARRRAAKTKLLRRRRRAVRTNTRWKTVGRRTAEDGRRRADRRDELRPQSPSFSRRLAPEKNLQLSRHSFVLRHRLSVVGDRRRRPTTRL